VFEGEFVSSAFRRRQEFQKLHVELKEVAKDARVYAGLQPINDKPSSWARTSPPVAISAFSEGGKSLSAVRLGSRARTKMAQREGGDSETISNGSSQSRSSLQQSLSQQQTLDYLEAENDRATARLHEVQQLRRDMSDVRELNETTLRMLNTQGESVSVVNTNVQNAQTSMQSGNRNLIEASRLHMTALTMSGAIVGAVVGGPVGALAGAKGAAALGGCAILGGVTGGVVTSKVTTAVHNANTNTITTVATPPRLRDN